MEVGQKPAVKPSPIAKHDGIDTVSLDELQHAFAQHPAIKVNPARRHDPDRAATAGIA
jgi:hypothetical protein